MVKKSKWQLMVATVIVCLAVFAGVWSTPVQAGPPFFKIYFMIPNSQPPRMVWGTLAAQQMEKIGIDVVSSYVPWSVIIPRRNKGEGQLHVDGGWDAYLERYYFNSIMPLPNTLFHSDLVPPNGRNYYYIADPVIDKALDDYSSATTQQAHMDAINRFNKR